MRLSLLDETRSAQNKRRTSGWKESMNMKTEKQRIRKELAAELRKFKKSKYIFRPNTSVGIFSSGAIEAIKLAAKIIGR